MSLFSLLLEHFNIFAAVYLNLVSMKFLTACSDQMAKHTKFLKTCLYLQGVFVVAQSVANLNLTCNSMFLKADDSSTKS